MCTCVPVATIAGVAICITAQISEAFVGFSGKEHKKGPMAYLLIHTIEIYCNVPSKC